MAIKEVDRKKDCRGAGKSADGWLKSKLKNIYFLKKVEIMIDHDERVNL